MKIREGEHKNEKERKDGTSLCQNCKNSCSSWLKSSLIDDNKFYNQSIGLNEWADTEVKAAFTSSEILSSSDASNGPKSLTNVKPLPNQLKDSTLTNLFEAIIFLARQGINFHQYHKQISLHSEDNFKALLQFKNKDISFIESDVYLRRELNDVQNQIIQILYDQMINQIIKDIGENPYSVILNEIINPVKGDRLAFIIRYINVDNQIKERFISLELVSKNKADLENLISNKLKTLKLSPDKLLSHTYEVNSNLDKLFRAAAQRIEEKYPRTIYVHNSSRKISLILQSCFSNILEVRNVLSTVNSLFNFIESIRKRNIRMSKRKSQKTLNNVYLTIKEMAKTNWTSRSLAISDTKKTYAAVLECLKLIDKNDKTFMGAKAKSLLVACWNFEFIFIIQVLSSVLEKTFSLSESMQECELDILIDQQNIINETFSKLYKLRSDLKFSEIFDYSFKDSAEIGIKTPQKQSDYQSSSIINNDQKNKTSKQVQFIDEFYHTIYFRIIDLAIDETKFRFTNISIIYHIAHILRNASHNSLPKLQGLGLYNELIDFKKLDKEIPNWNEVITELSFKEQCINIRQAKIDKQITTNASQSKSSKLREKRARLAGLPFMIHEIYQAFIQLRLQEKFPQLNVLFIIYLSMPVSNPNVQNSPSVLRRLKYWLKSSGNNEVHSLALLNIEKELIEKIDIPSSIEIFYKQLNTKIEN